MFLIRVSKDGNNLDLRGDNQISKNINLYDLFDRPNITFSQYVERHGAWEDR